MLVVQLTKCQLKYVQYVVMLWQCVGWLKLRVSVVKNLWLLV
ncbi:Uncharacterised protein [Vibrio cholerae]|nr:Uncharacterised protein [Vibrio cholerae]